MTDFKSEFEKLVTDSDLANVDENFNRVFPANDFVIDDKEVDRVIEELYMQCEKYEPILKSAEIHDDILEKLSNESIVDILRDVFGEEIKARPVSVLAKELESNILKREAENRLSMLSTRSSSYLTARDDIDFSDYESPGEESDHFSDYNSCDEGLESPSIVRMIMNEPTFIKSYSEQEEVEEKFVVAVDRVNDVGIREKEENDTEKDDKMGGISQEVFTAESCRDAVIRTAERVNDAGFRVKKERIIMNEPTFIKSYSEQEEVEEKFVTATERVNDVGFRVKKEDNTESDDEIDEMGEESQEVFIAESCKDAVRTAERMNDDDNKRMIMNRPMLIKSYCEQELEEKFVTASERVNDVKFLIRKQDDTEREDENDEMGKEKLEVFTVKDSSDNNKELEIRKDEEEKDSERNQKKAEEIQVDAKLRRKEYRETSQKSIEDNECELNRLNGETERKRKLSQKAAEVAENIVVGKPIRSATVDSPQKLPLINAPFVKKDRPIRRSFERVSTEEHRTKFLELLKKMELKQDDESYHSVYENH